VKKSQAGGGVAVKIEHAVYETAKMVGRHFDENDELLSMISRQSIDVLKVGLYLLMAARIFLIPTYIQDTFRNDVSKEEWLLIKNLKGVSCLLSHRSTTMLTISLAVECTLNGIHLTKYLSRRVSVLLYPFACTHEFYPWSYPNVCKRRVRI
jgi:hypothetical protein